jgi:hypothetical protein
MKQLRSLAFFLICTPVLLLGQSNPRPLLYPSLVPVSTAPGRRPFTLTVNGTGFVAGAVVGWNGSPRTTKFISSSQLEARISAADVAKAGTASITALNPAPGGGISNVIYFPIRKPASTVALTLDKGFTATGTASVVGDFNNDGKLDVVVTNGNQIGGGGTISLYRGNGDGTFQSPVVTTSSDVASCALSGDVNGDGKLDLLCTGANYNGVYGVVFLNNGDGTFAELSSGFGEGDYTGPIAVADFNGDGKLDVVTLGSSSGAVFVAFFLGNGDGTFTGPVSQAPCCLVNGGPVAFGDFNGDGKLDVAVMDYAFSIYICLGNGDGTFQAPTLYTPKNFSYDMAVVDINGDGKLDLLTDAGSVLLGNGDGTFTKGADFSGAGGIWLGDFNGDGKLDVLTTKAISYQNDQILLLLGNGKGTFHNPVVLAQGPTGFGLGVGDFNGDGRLDVLATDSVSGTNYLFIQKPPQ